MEKLQAYSHLSKVDHSKKVLRINCWAIQFNSMPSACFFTLGKCLEQYWLKQGKIGFQSFKSFTIKLPFLLYRLFSLAFIWAILFWLAIPHFYNPNTKMIKFETFKTYQISCIRPLIIWRRSLILCVAQYCLWQSATLTNWLTT